MAEAIPFVHDIPDDDASQMHVTIGAGSTDGAAATGAAIPFVKDLPDDTHEDKPKAPTTGHELSPAENYTAGALEAADPLTFNMSRQLAKYAFAAQKDGSLLPSEQTMNDANDYVHNLTGQFEQEHPYAASGLAAAGNVASMAVGSPVQMAERGLSKMGLIKAAEGAADPVGRAAATLRRAGDGMATGMTYGYFGSDAHDQGTKLADGLMLSTPLAATNAALPVAARPLGNMAARAVDWMKGDSVPAILRPAAQRTSDLISSYTAQDPEQLQVPSGSTLSEGLVAGNRVPGALDDYSINNAATAHLGNATPEARLDLLTALRQRDAGVGPRMQDQIAQATGHASGEDMMRRINSEYASDIAPQYGQLSTDAATDMYPYLEAAKGSYPIQALDMSAETAARRGANDPIRQNVAMGENGPAVRNSEIWRANSQDPMLAKQRNQRVNLTMDDFSPESQKLLTDHVSDNDAPLVSIDQKTGDVTGKLANMADITGLDEPALAPYLNSRGYTDLSTLHPDTIAGLRANGAFNMSPMGAHVYQSGLGAAGQVAADKLAGPFGRATPASREAMLNANQARDQFLEALPDDLQNGDLMGQARRAITAQTAYSRGPEMWDSSMTPDQLDALYGRYAPKDGAGPEDAAAADNAKLAFKTGATGELLDNLGEKRGNANSTQRDLRDNADLQSKMQQVYGPDATGQIIDAVNTAVDQRRTMNDVLSNGKSRTAPLTEEASKSKEMGQDSRSIFDKITQGAGFDDPRLAPFKKGKQNDSVAKSLLSLDPQEQQLALATVGKFRRSQARGDAYGAFLSRNGATNPLAAYLSKNVQIQEDMDPHSILMSPTIYPMMFPSLFKGLGGEHLPDELMNDIPETVNQTAGKG